jgi:hypothetical protein
MFFRKYKEDWQVRQELADWFKQLRQVSWQRTHSSIDSSWKVEIGQEPFYTQEKLEKYSRGSQEIHSEDRDPLHSAHVSWHSKHPN